MSLPASAWKTVGWRPGTPKPLRSRFAALRLRPAHRDYESSQPRPEEWLLIEWPKAEAGPTKYWLSTLPVNTPLADLVRLAKQRWIIERDYQELKQELRWAQMASVASSNSIRIRDASPQPRMPADAHRC